MSEIKSIKNLLADDRIYIPEEATPLLLFSDDEEPSMEC